MKRSLLLSICLLLLPVMPALAQDPPVGEANPLVAEAPPTTGADTESLAKATQNPVASLISVPIQNNSNFNIGPYNRTQDVLNIQPVIPVKLNDNWNLD